MTLLYGPWACLKEQAPTKDGFEKSYVHGMERYKSIRLFRNRFLATARNIQQIHLQTQAQLAFNGFTTVQGCKD